MMDMNITIHLSGAIDWTGWILAMILAGVCGILLYGTVRFFRWSENLSTTFASGSEARRKIPIIVKPKIVLGPSRPPLRTST